METRVLGAEDGGVAAAVGALRAGDCVAVPTETVYGLAADGLDARACAGIFEAKGRPLSDPLILHVPDREWLERLGEAGEVAGRLAEALWPGPLTLVVPRRGTVVPDIVTAGQETVALRMSAHPVMAAVLREFGRPVTAPSANRFCRISPTTAAAVVAELGGRIGLVIDGGACAHGLESTIVRVGEAGLEILREGPITAEDLARIGPVRARTGEGGPVVPGGMKRHYSPGTPFAIVAELPEEGRERMGLLEFDRLDATGFAAVETLSAAGDLREAAGNLYGAMRRLDEAGLERIVARGVPEIGIGRAIMDRMRKAAG